MKKYYITLCLLLIAHFYGYAQELTQSLHILTTTLNNLHKMLKPTRRVTGKLFEFDREKNFSTYRHQLTFSSDGRYLGIIKLSERFAPGILIWNVDNWQKVTILPGDRFTFWGHGKYLAYNRGIYDIANKQNLIQYDKTFRGSYAASSPSTYLAKDREGVSDFDIYHENNPKEVMLTVPSSPLFVSDTSVIYAVSQDEKKEFYQQPLQKGAARELLSFSPPPLVTTEEGYTTHFEAPNISPKGNYIAFYYDVEDNTHVYSLKTKKKINVFPGAYQTTFSHDEKYFVTPEGIYELATATKIGDVRGGEIVASPTQNYVISTPYSSNISTSTMYVYDIPTGRVIKEINGAGPVFSPDGSMLAFFRGTTMQVWGFESLIKE